MSGRGRGRPRKYPEKQVEDIRRGRGRPRKVENSQSRENLPRILDADKFRGRGRPRKAAVSLSIQSSDKSLETEEDSVQMYEKEPVPAAEPLVLISASMPDSQKERWRLRSMWELAAVLDFLHVFRPVLNITMEFSAEELETALITPNNILRELHILLLKGIPPVSRTALGSDTWVTALCKKIAPWWPWVAEGEVPLVTCHGEEIQSYKALDPGTRLLILKALCEIRLDQDDVWKYIDDSLKQSTQLSTFSKVSLGGDAHGISYWYDGDSIIGHRLYREIRKIEVKPKPKGKGRTPEPVITCQWETIATDLDEFQTLSEKLTSSRNKLEAGIGKKIKNDILPVLEELQKKKERALKKQQRQAMLLDSFFGAQGEAGGRSRRDRKPVKYTFDDYDRSIDEAIQLTKKNRHAPEPLLRRDITMGDNPESNGHGSNPENALSSESKERSEESDAVREPGLLTRSNRLRPRAQGYLQRKYVSDDDVGDGDGEFMEAVNDAGQTGSQKDRNVSGSSEGEEHSEDDGDEEYKEDDGDEEYKEDDGDEEYREDEDDLEVDDDDEDLSIDSDGRQARRRHSSRRKTRWKSHYEEDESISADDYDDDDDGHRRQRSNRGKKRGKPIDEVQAGLRRSKRATRIDYSKYEMSNSEEENSVESETQVNGGELKKESDVSKSVDSNVENESCLNKPSEQARDEKQPNTEEAQSCEAFTEPVIKSWEQFREQSLDLKSRHFIDLNEAAPLSGFDDFSCDTMTKQIGPEDSVYEQVQNRENDDKC